MAPGGGRQPRGGEDIPKSLMLNTPGTLELARRFSLGGLEERPWTAESTLDKGVGAASADMVDEVLYSGSQIEVEAVRG